MIIAPLLPQSYPAFTGTTLCTNSYKRITEETQVLKPRDQPARMRPHTTAESSSITNESASVAIATAARMQKPSPRTARCERCQPWCGCTVGLGGTSRRRELNRARHPAPFHRTGGRPCEAARVQFGGPTQHPQPGRLVIFSDADAGWVARFLLP